MLLFPRTLVRIRENGNIENKNQEYGLDKFFFLSKLSESGTVNRRKRKKEEG